MLYIVIPEIPPSLNQWARNWHWSKVRSEKVRWEEMVWALVHEAGKPQEPMKRTRVRFEFWFPDRRRRDPDNCSVKWILDGLVKAGVLEDDTFDHVTISKKKVGVDKQNPRTEVIVEEVV